MRLYSQAKLPFQATLALILALGMLQTPGLRAIGAAAPASQVRVATPGGSQTTADIMARGTIDRVATPVQSGITLNKVQPNRRSLPGSPPESANSAWSSSARTLVSDPPSLAQTVSSPNADVVTLADTMTVPPDTMGDVGPTQYLVGVNGRIRTISKTTGLPDGVLDANMDTFFDAVRNGQVTTDPSVRYDRRVGRWYVLVINIALPNRYLLAVSNEADITSGTAWTFFFWDNTRLSATTSDPCVSDSPTLGVDEDALYIGANQFCGPDQDSVTYDSSSAYVIPKAPLLTGGPPAPPQLTFASFDEVALGVNPGLYAPQGVDNFDNDTNVGYLIAVDNAQLSRLQIRRVLDPGGTPTLAPGLVTIDVATTQPPIPVPHPSGLAGLDAQDDRLQQAVIRNGRLWTNHQIEVNASGTGEAGGGRNGIRWYEIENLGAAPAVRQFGTVFDPATLTPASYFVGSVMVSGQGHVALGSTVAGASTFVNAAVAGRLATDPLGTMNGPPEQFTTNTSFTYNVEAPPEPQRWGDHSSTSVDPNDDMTMWTLQQYVQANDWYALRLVRLLAPSPAEIVSLSPSTVTTGRTGVRITVTGLSSAGSGFFDPGPGFPNRIAAEFSGVGITVTGVTVLSPTELVLTVDTTGASAGGRGLTLTNPDGQSVQRAAALTVQVNQAPIAAADAYSTSFNTPLVVPVPGVLVNDTDPNGESLTAALVAGPSHGALTLDLNGSFTYTPAPGYSGPDAFTYQASDGVLGSGITTVGLTVVPNSAPIATPDAYGTAFGTPLTIAAPGVLTNDTDADDDALTAMPATTTSHGALVLNANGSFTYTPAAGYAGLDSFTYRVSDGLSTSAITTVSLTVGQPATVQPPTGLFAYSVSGNVVTLRWTPPAVGPAPTNYAIEGGINPGEVLASIPTGNTYPIHTFVAPTGSFYVRLHAISGSERSAASNEIRLHVNVPAPPSTPADLVGLVNGSTVDLAWRNTFSGGVPDTLLLDVTGAAVTTIPVGYSDRFSFAAVPGGTYTLRLRAANAAGVSGPSNAVTLTFPGGCSGSPEPPSDFLAYKVGATIFVVWNPAATGPAPTGYVLNVTGAFAGSFSTTGRALSGTVGPGAYQLAVVATNACGSSAPTSTQAINIP